MGFNHNMSRRAFRPERSRAVRKGLWSEKVTGDDGPYFDAFSNYPSLGPELKFHYVLSPVAETPPNNNIFVNCLNIVPRGTDFNQRIGRQVSAKAISIKGYANKFLGSDPPDVLRLLLLWDIAVGSLTIPTNAELFVDTANANGHCGHLLPRVASKFRVLWDLMIPINDTSEGGNHKSFIIDKRIELPNWVVRASDTGGIDDVDAGAIWFVRTSVGGASSLIWQACFEFTDD